MQGGLFVTSGLHTADPFFDTEVQTYEIDV